jgi:Spy/CpxP family protein refolding chaperone
MHPKPRKEHMMKKWIALTAISGTLALTLAVFAAPRDKRGDGPPRGPDGPHPMMRLLDNPEATEKLGLTEEQVAALKEVRYETQKQSVALQADAELAQLELQRVLQSDSPDEAAAHAAIEQAGQARIKLQQSRVSALLQAREAIGAEKWNEIKARGRRQMKERAGNMRERMEQRRQQFQDGPRGDRPARPGARRPGPGPQDGPPDA